MKVYTALAGMAGFWGPWVLLEGFITGDKPTILELEAKAISNVPGPFDGQIQFFPHRIAPSIVREFPCPGKTLVRLAAGSIQQPKVRFRSLTINGLVVRVITGGIFVPATLKNYRDYRVPKDVPLPVDASLEGRFPEIA